VTPGAFRAVLVAWSLGFSAPPAGAEVADYEVTSSEWSGLANFADLARGLGLGVEARRNLAWDDVEQGDVLFILYPTTRLDPGQLAAFLHSGGSLAIADDFGTGGELLARLGLLREGAVAVGDSFYRELPIAPVALPTGAHPLTEGVASIVANHPAILPDRGTYNVVFSFGPNQGLVATKQLGRGRIVVISDPSIFINRMLQFPGNTQFAVNLLRNLATGDDATVHLLTGDVALRGRPSLPEVTGPASDQARGLLANINRRLDEWNEYVLTGAGMQAFGLLAVVLTAFLLVLALPIRRGYRPEGQWLRVAADPRPGDAQRAIRNVQNGDKNYVVPAAALRDAVDHLLRRHLGLSHPLAEHAAPALIQALQGARGPRAAALLPPVLAILARVPPMTEASLPWGSFFFPRSDFQSLQQRVDELCRTLNAGDPSAHGFP